MLRLALGLGRQWAGLGLHSGVRSAFVNIDARRHNIAYGRGLAGSDGGDNVLLT